jgi:hypothetical protein
LKDAGSNGDDEDDENYTKEVEEEESEEESEPKRLKNNEAVAVTRKSPRKQKSKETKMVDEAEGSKKGASE